MKTGIITKLDITGNGELETTGKKALQFHISGISGVIVTKLDISTIAEILQKYAIGTPVQYEITLVYGKKIPVNIQKIN